MKQPLLFLLLIPFLGMSQVYTYQTTGSSNYHTQYNGGIGANKTFKLPTGTRNTIYNFDKKGLLQVNSLSNNLEYNNGLEWKTILDSIRGVQLFKPISYVPAYSELTGKPDLSVYYLASNPNGYISSVPAQSWSSITGKPTTLLGYGITDAYPLSSNPANYLTGITQAQVNTALGITPINISGARNAISVTNVGMMGNATYNSATGVINIPNYSARVYTGSSTVSSNGNATFILTVDGTSTGAALYNNVAFASPFVNDSSRNYTYGWTYDATTKTLTVNTKVSNSVMIGTTAVLAAPSNVANGTTVTVLVRGS